jgi:hypothetical protein
VQVTAATLYEAVALGFASLRGEEWVSGIADGLNAVRVSGMNDPVEHSVKMQDSNASLGREGGTPRERADRSRIRKILGVDAPRSDGCERTQPDSTGVFDRLQVVVSKKCLGRGSSSRCV